jgi:hypothetical protein
MRDREFVWTWWAGLVRDSFGPGSIFHVARVGSLRRSLRVRRVTPIGGGKTVGKPPIGVRLACDFLLVPITKLRSVVGGLLKKLSGVLDREKEAIE